MNLINRNAIEDVQLRACMPVEIKGKRRERSFTLGCNNRSLRDQVSDMYSRCLLSDADHLIEPFMARVPISYYVWSAAGAVEYPIAHTSIKDLELALNHLNRHCDCEMKREIMALMSISNLELPELLTLHEFIQPKLYLDTVEGFLKSRSDELDAVLKLDLKTVHPYYAWDRYERYVFGSRRGIYTTDFGILELDWKIDMWEKLWNKID